MKPKILVTGSNGQLGNELRLMAEREDKLTFVFTDVAELDITQPEAVKATLQSFHPQYLINCAAYTAVDKAESEKEIAWEINAKAPEILAQAAHETDTCLIHISTDYVFDGKNYRPYLPSHPTHPISWYGMSKAGGEIAILKSNAKAFIIRTAWLYSRFGNNFVKTIRRLASQKHDLNVVYDQIGSPTWAADLAELILHIILHQIIPNGCEILHYTNEGVCSWYDFAINIVEHSNLNCTIHPISTEQYPQPAQRPFYSVLNKSLTSQRFNIEIPHWNKSLEKCITSLDE